MRFSALTPEFKAFRENYEQTSIDLLPGRRESLHPLTVIGEAFKSYVMEKAGLVYEVSFAAPLHLDDAPRKLTSLPRIMLGPDAVSVPRLAKYQKVLVLCACTEQELQDSAKPLFVGGTTDPLIMANSFRGGIEIADNVQAKIDAVLVVANQDGQAFDQIAYAAFVAKNLRAPFFVMPVITHQESELLTTLVEQEVQRREYEKQTWTPKAAESGNTVLVDQFGNVAAVELDLPAGIEQMVEPQADRIVIEMQHPDENAAVDDPTETIADSTTGDQAVVHESTDEDLPL